uniref:Pancreatic trypsin inhibitor n=1 Tax=Rhipicephalus appendiculatus TaxID=34631 RepID=A0A131YPR2_RHIAP
MVNAHVLCFLLSAHVIPQHLASPIGRGTPKLQNKCLTATTVEGCDTILLSWSYSNETNECEKGFVCHECPNRFETFDDCSIACNMVSMPIDKPKPIPKPVFPKPKPKPRPRSCRFWLMRGGCCQAVWLDFAKNFWGQMRRQLFYTGCRQDKYRVFVYDFRGKKCREVKNNRPKENEWPKEDHLYDINERARGCPRKASRPSRGKPGKTTKPPARHPHSLPRKPSKPNKPNQTSKPNNGPSSPAQDKTQEARRT